MQIIPNVVLWKTKHDINKTFVEMMKINNYLYEKSEGITSSTFKRIRVMVKFCNNKLGNFDGIENFLRRYKLSKVIKGVEKWTAIHVLSTWYVAKIKKEVKIAVKSFQILKRK